MKKQCLRCGQYDVKVPPLILRLAPLVLPVAGVLFCGVMQSTNRLEIRLIAFAVIPVSLVISHLISRSLYFTCRRCGLKWQEKGQYTDSGWFDYWYSND